MSFVRARDSLCPGIGYQSRQDAKKGVMHFVAFSFEVA